MWLTAEVELQGWRLSFLSKIQLPELQRVPAFMCETREHKNSPHSCERLGATRPYMTCDSRDTPLWKDDGSPVLVFPLQAKKCAPQATVLVCIVFWWGRWAKGKADDINKRVGCTRHERKEALWEAQEEEKAIARNATTRNRKSRYKKGITNKAIHGHDMQTKHHTEVKGGIKK